MKQKDKGLSTIDVVIGNWLSSIIPIPLANRVIGYAIMRYKGQILVVITSFVLILILFIFGKPIAKANESHDGFQNTPKELIGYHEDGYTDTNYPAKSPLGGSGVDWIEITAYWHDYNYYKIFGEWHDGLDIVPNYIYFANSKAYKLTGKYIIISTMTGKACSYGDTDKEGLSVSIVNDDNSLKTLYHHQSANFIPLGTCTYVHNGQPLGIMGMTGHATGVHVHYGNYKNENGTWVSYDPYESLFK